jgi:DNA invertase Pin-like site-specific DNA recombinase
MFMSTPESRVDINMNANDINANDAALAITATAYSYIRFSTPDQEMGDSERRQLALAKAYCQQNGLTLAETIADRGKSAFHGNHRERGNLGGLLKQMKPGQVLLIEDCDRWSREDPIDALSRLREEVRRGIEIVFLRTGTRVTSANFSDIGILAPNFFAALLGNGESVKKGERIQAVWTEKKALARAGKSVRMNRLPCWLEWDGARDKPVVIETKATVVRKLYELACAGNGVLEICREMCGTPPITRGGKNLKSLWNPTTVRRLLTAKSTIGYYVEGEPTVPNFWPQVVSEEVFCIAQAKLNIAARDKRPGHESQSNLFTGLIRCGRCQERHGLIAHRSSRPGNGRPRLVCGGASKGRSDCGFTGTPLDLVEKSFLKLVTEGNLVRPLLQQAQIGGGQDEAIEG